MTIRELIQKQMKSGWIVAGVSFAASLATNILLADTRHQWISIIPGSVFVGTCIYFYWFIRCPKCHVAFGPFAVWRAGSDNSCSHCDVDFDQPLGGP